MPGERTDTKLMPTGFPCLGGVADGGSARKSGYSFDPCTGVSANAPSVRPCFPHVSPEERGKLLPGASTSEMGVEIKLAFSPRTHLLPRQGVLDQTETPPDPLPCLPRAEAPWQRQAADMASTLVTVYSCILSAKNVERMMVNIDHPGLLALSSVFCFGSLPSSQLVRVSHLRADSDLGPSNALGDD